MRILRVGGVWIGFGCSFGLNRRLGSRWTSILAFKFILLKFGLVFVASIHIFRLRAGTRCFAALVQAAVSCQYLNLF